MSRAPADDDARAMTTTTPSPVSLTDDQPARLCRSATDRMIGGVCGGLARYSGIDAVLWRVGFVALTLLGGSGLLFYALLWVLMPSQPGAERNVLDRFADRLHDALHGAARDLRRP
jgi:phage shock protein C